MTSDQSVTSQAFEKLGDALGLVVKDGAPNREKVQAIINGVIGKADEMSAEHINNLTNSIHGFEQGKFTESSVASDLDAYINSNGLDPNNLDGQAISGFMAGMGVPIVASVAADYVGVDINGTAQKIYSAMRDSFTALKDKAKPQEPEVTQKRDSGNPFDILSFLSNPAEGMGGLTSIWENIKAALSNFSGMIKQFFGFDISPLLQTGDNLVSTAQSAFGGSDSSSDNAPDPNDPRYRQDHNANGPAAQARQEIARNQTPLEGSHETDNEQSSPSSIKPAFDVAAIEQQQVALASEILNKYGAQLENFEGMLSAKGIKIDTAPNLVESIRSQEAQNGLNQLASLAGSDTQKTISGYLKEFNSLQAQIDSPPEAHAEQSQEETLTDNAPAATLDRTLAPKIGG